MDLIRRLLADGRSSRRPWPGVERHQRRGSGLLAGHFDGYSKPSGAYAAGHLLAGDPFAMVLIGDLLYSDARFLASGVKRRSRLRLAVGAARLRGTIRGLSLGPTLARRSATPSSGERT